MNCSFALNTFGTKIVVLARTARETCQAESRGERQRRTTENKTVGKKADHLLVIYADCVRPAVYAR